MPVVRSINPVMSTAIIDKLLDTLNVVPLAALAVAPVCKLFTAPSANLLPTWVPADFTEATFNGYLPIGSVYAAPSVNLESGNGKGDAANGLFVVGGGGVPPGEVIVGYWTEDSTGHPLIAELFPTPVAMVFPGDFIDLTQIFALAFKTPQV